MVNLLGSCPDEEVRDKRKESHSLREQVKFQRMNKKAQLLRLAHSEIEEKELLLLF